MNWVHLVRELGLICIKGGEWRHQVNGHQLFMKIRSMKSGSSVISVLGNTPNLRTCFKPATFSACDVLKPIKVC